MMGPHIDPLGERKEKEQLYTKQFAATIAKLTGEEFSQAIASAYASKK
jgi:hypothetical protein